MKLNVPRQTSAQAATAMGMDHTGMGQLVGISSAAAIPPISAASTISDTPRKGSSVIAKNLEDVFHRRCAMRLRTICEPRTASRGARYDSCPYGLQPPQRAHVLYTIAVILVILWLLGFLAFHVGGGFIHLLLVIAIIVVLVRIIQGRRPV
jgi:hypothetical protein